MRPRLIIRWLVTIVGTAALMGVPSHNSTLHGVAIAQGVTRGVVMESAERVPGNVVVRYSTSVPGTQLNLLAEHGLTHVHSIAEIGLHLVRTEPGNELHAIRRLQADPRVAFAEPNYIAHAVAVPSDPSYPHQYDMPLIGMERAWDATTGSASVVTAVIDTGIDLAHPELRGRIANLTGPGLPEADHVFLSAPAPTCAPVTTPDDDGWTQHVAHGTHVAGTIAAESSLAGAPAIGIAGIAPSTRLAPLKALDCEGHGTFFDIERAITFAAAHRVNVINMSLGTVGDSSTCLAGLQAAIDLAYANGVFIAVAAGNSGNTDRSIPAVCNNVVGVGASNAQDVISGFSQRNSTVDLSAPGVDILSTLRTGPTQHSSGSLSGTSMATPHVAGCAALLFAGADPNRPMTPDRIEQILRDTAVDLGSPGRDDSYGSGRLDCGAAVGSLVHPSRMMRSPAVR